MEEEVVKQEIGKFLNRIMSAGHEVTTKDKLRAAELLGMLHGLFGYEVIND